MKQVHWLAILSLIGGISAVPLLIAFYLVGWDARGTAVYQTYEMFNQLMVGSMLLMATGWLGLYLRRDDGYGRWATLLALLGCLMMVTGTAAEFWLFSDLPYVGQNLRQTAFTIFSIGSLLLDVGATAISVAVWRSRIWPHWSAIILLVALPLDLAAFFWLSGIFVTVTVLSLVVGYNLLILQKTDRIITQLPMTLLPTLRTPFTRYHLLLARLGWLTICLLILSMIASSLPHLYTDIRNEWRVGEARTAALQLFSSRDAYLYTIITLRLITLSTFIFTAFFLAWRKWNDWFVLYISTTLLMLGYFFGMDFNIDVIRYPQWLAQNFPAVRAVVPSLIAINMVLFFYLFPNGRFTPRWLIWFTIPSILFILTFMGETFYEGMPWTPLLEYVVGWLLQALNLGPDRWFYIFSATLIITMLIGLVSQLLRFRDTLPGIARQQIKWVILGLATIPLGPSLNLFFFYLLPGSYSTQQLISLISGIILPLAIPLTLAFSMLRYRLWEVDIWINRTVVYGGLTAVILTLYGLSIGLLSQLMPTQDDLLIAFLGLIVALFVANPLRRQLQHGVNHLLPIPPQPPPETKATPTPITAPTPLLRLAHIFWVIAFSYALWLAFERLRLSALVIGLGDDYLVQDSLKLFPQSSNRFLQYVLWLRISATAVFWFTALFIFWHKRHDWVALAAAFIFIYTPFGFILGGQNDPVTATVSFIGLLLSAAFPFVFPDGRFVPQSRRWQLALTGGLLLVPILTYNISRILLPIYRPDELGYVSFMVTIAILTLAAVYSQVYRYRHLSTPSQRQQTKWVLIGFVAPGLIFIWVLLWLFGFLQWLDLSEPTVTLVMIHLNMLGLPIMPITFALSIWRYRLWEVDVWINRTLVFGGLTLLVTAVYILTVGLMSNLFHSGNSLTLSVLATGLIAILFNPVRQRLQTAVNRLMYGQRDDPITVLAELGRRLEETAVPGETLPALVQTIAQTLKLPYVAIVTDEDDLVTAVGAEQGTVQTFPLIYQSRPIGRLLVAPRQTHETFTTDEERLLRNVARQAGAAVYAYQLTNQLQRSRERLVTMREEERRRLRRDLHDGLGPQLAAVAIKVNATQNLLHSDPDQAQKLLTEIKTEAQQAIQEIRRVVDGLRPSILDQLGLASALREFGAQNSNGRVPITLHTPADLPPLPAAVEVAAYRIITEAVTNTLRHANAYHCHIRLTIDDVMMLEVRDDGCGLPPEIPHGIGLFSMQERAEELGGTFVISSEPGRGTQIIAHLPLMDNQ